MVLEALRARLRNLINWLTYRRKSKLFDQYNKPCAFTFYGTVLHSSGKSYHLEFTVIEELEGQPPTFARYLHDQTKKLFDKLKSGEVPQRCMMETYSGFEELFSSDWIGANVVAFTVNPDHKYPRGVQHWFMRNVLRQKVPSNPRLL